MWGSPIHIWKPQSHPKVDSSFASNTATYTTTYTTTTIHPRDADHRRDTDHHGGNYIGTEFELKESPEWKESKEHEPKTSERPL